MTSKTVPLRMKKVIRNEPNQITANNRNKVCTKQVKCPALHFCKALKSGRFYLPVVTEVLQEISVFRLLFNRSSESFFCTRTARKRLKYWKKPCCPCTET